MVGVATLTGGTITAIHIEGSDMGVRASAHASRKAGSP